MPDPLQIIPPPPEVPTLPTAEQILAANKEAFHNAIVAELRGFHAETSARYVQLLTRLNTESEGLTAEQKRASFTDPEWAQLTALAIGLGNTLNIPATVVPVPDPA